MGFFFSPKCHSWLCAQGSKEWTTFCIFYPTLAGGHRRSGKQELWHPVISLFSSFYWNITEKRCQYILFLEGFQQCMNSLYIWPCSLFLIYNLAADLRIFIILLQSSSSHWSPAPFITWANPNIVKCPSFHELWLAEELPCMIK